MYFERETAQGLVLINVRDGYTFIALEQAQVCPCGRLMHFAINREGRTICVACNAERHADAA